MYFVIHTQYLVFNAGNQFSEISFSLQQKKIAHRNEKFSHSICLIYFLKFPLDF